MHGVFRLGISLMFSTLCLAQTGPAVSESPATYRDSSRVSDLAHLNFDEFAVRVDTKSYRLHKGVYKRFAHGRGGYELELRRTWLIPGTQGKPQYALIYFIETAIGASSSQTGYVQLLALENEHLVLKQEFRFIPKGEEAGCTFDIPTGELRIVAKSDDPSPDSAPRSTDHCLYTWNGNRFLFSTWKAIPNGKPVSLLTMHPNPSFNPDPRERGPVNFFR